MRAVQTMRRVGFRKWYERELLQSHAHLVLLLLSLLGMLGGIEALHGQLEPFTQLSLVACAVVSAGIGYWALRRYFYLLHHAEFIADQAVCSQCDSYGRWDITREDQVAEKMQVCCKRCGHLWDIAL